MRYEGNIFTPGSAESQSYILQVTMGCAHNKCTFCSFFKDKPFRVRPYNEIEEDIMAARSYFKHVPSVFLADGNVTCLSMDKLRPILKKIKEVFPESKHTNMYGSYKDIYRKTVEELREMKELGVSFIYTGLESGSNIVLSDIKKGYTAEEAIIAGKKIAEAGIGFSSGAILGLGGVKNSEDHVKESIRVMNEINATGVGIMVLNPQAGTPLYDDIKSGEFELPTYRQIFKEEAEILKGLDIKHPTFVYSGGFLPNNKVMAFNLPEDREYMLEMLEKRNEEFAELLDEKIRVNGSL
jgi:radical SAM superfamily enzyme YgiQ (UPF0313 family)